MTPKRPRKPETVLRRLGVSLSAAAFWLTKEETNVAHANLDTARCLFRELRKSLKARPACPHVSKGSTVLFCSICSRAARRAKGDRR
jgi:hypothetical protein